jgi:hypothetical protein
MDRPGLHPPPCPDLERREPIIREVNDALWRIHRVVPLHGPLYFGKSRENRFDAPAGEYGVLYVGVDAFAAFIETLGWRTGVKVVSERNLQIRGLAKLSPSRPLRLVDLVVSGGLVRIGADARLFAGEHSISQQWSRALWQHPTAPDGILYPARHDPARNACALFDRCSDVLTVECLGSLGGPSLASLVGHILDQYQFALV